jgi:hypothetical protein
LANLLPEVRGWLSHFFAMTSVRAITYLGSITQWTSFASCWLCQAMTWIPK